MSVGCRHNAAVCVCLFLSVSLLLAGWSPLTSGTSEILNSVQFPVDATVGYVVGDKGTILKTTDAGSSWVPQTSGTSKSLKSVSFVDNSSGFTVGDSGAALKTTDGGATWTPMDVGITGALLHVQLVGTSGTAYLAYDTRSASGIRKTTDWGASWQATGSLPGMAPKVKCVCFTSEAVGYVAGPGQFTAKTPDGGATWQILGTGTIGLSFNALAFRPGEPAVGFIAGTEGTVLETEDYGATWENLDACSTAAYFVLSFPATNSVFAAGTGGMIAKYTPGSGWKKQASGAGTFYGLSFPVDGTTGYAVGTNGVILKTTDGGLGWEEGRSQAPVRTGIRVVSSPCRHGIALHSDRDAAVTVYDAAGRAVMSRAATRGLNFLPLPTGAYFVKAGASTARAIVTD